MDFYEIVVKEPKGRSKVDLNVTVDFIYGQPKDLVCKGGDFYAFWDAPKNLWNTDRYALYAKIDREIREKKKQLEEKDPDLIISTSTMRSHSSGKVTQFVQYLKQMSTPPVTFNSKIFFLSQTPKQTDYVTSKLGYDPAEIETPAFDEVMSVLYKPEELDKILWFMGVLLTGQTRKIQKFMYLYGGKGTGKGTVINMFREMFDGYTDSIDLERLTGNSEFATSQVTEVPLLIDDDSDMSKITKDVNLLKLTAHEPIPVNKKFAKVYDTIFTGLLITASNQRYQVRNVDSGITRRAVVVEPSGERVSRKKYDELVSKLKFEIPGIAQKAIDHVGRVGLFVYENTMDVGMAEATDLIFSFIREYGDKFSDTITLKQAAALYKEFLEDLGYDTKGYKRRIKIELQRYYDEFHRQRKIDGLNMENVFVGFKRDIVFPEEFDHINNKTEAPTNPIGLSLQQSLFDDICKNYPAQLTTSSGIPLEKWDECKTILSDIDTKQLHFVRVPMNHIVLDFDLKDAEGNKNLYLNLEEASKYPETYAEVSKSGQGIHLHYYYDGDVEKLAPNITDDVEVKVFKGGMSLRRKLTTCNNKPIAHISTGIPYKEEKPVLEGAVEEIMWNDKKIRTVVEKNLAKEYHSATKPSIDFIAHILDEAYKGGVKYDVTDMRNAVIAFAMKSSHNVDYCLNVVKKMQFSSMEDEETQLSIQNNVYIADDKDLYFFDIEIFPNLMIVAYSTLDKKTDRGVWFNPSPDQVEWLCKHPIVAFNCRRYDNHILYSAMLGKTNLELYHQSASIIDKNAPKGAGMIAAAYELSYVDIYEFSTDKKSLKKWEADLGIKHDEFEEPWDQPLAEHKWERAGEYCMNDVDAEIDVFQHIYSEYKARLILAQLSGLSVNSSTQQHAAKFLFGDDPRPQDKFVYTDLSEEFPGYEFGFGEPVGGGKPRMRSIYRGEDPGEGGYVYSEPGVYKDVLLDDIASMHPSTAVEINYFGPYTPRFKELLDARLAVKHHDFETAGSMFGGILKPYLTDEDYEDLAFALKIIINIVYGMTSASYDNKFKHKKNVDNIIAKRGALFMIDLKHAVQEMGYTVAHIKTDSIKIPNYDEKIKKFIHEFGAKYGYTFEHEATYEKFALVNKSVYIAKYGWAEKERKIGTWEPTGAQFADPYVFKTLFSKEEISETDYRVTKQATAPIYIDEEFVGKVCQVYASHTGGVMTRRDGEKIGAVTGTKKHKWRLFTDFKGTDDIDMSYYEGLVLDAIKNIDSVGHVGEIIEDIPEVYKEMMLPF